MISIFWKIQRVKNNFMKVNNLIEDRDITAVIQGPLYLDEHTKGADIIQCIKCIKNVLPGSQIIISTWMNEKKHHKKLMPIVDKIIYSEQPSAILSYDVPNNVKRQIVSSKAGLSKVKTKYSLKLRANTLLKEKSEFFANPGNKINIPALVSDPVYSFSLFGLPDFLQFGKTDRIRTFWDVDISDEDEFLNSAYQSIFDIYSFPHSFKFSPEQYIGISWAKNEYKSIPLIKHQFDINYSDFLFWKHILISDFTLVPLKVMGFVFVPERYTFGRFIDANNLWITRASRFQFIHLLINKYALFFLNRKWWVHLAKLSVYTFSKSLFWSIYKAGK